MAPHIRASLLWLYAGTPGFIALGGFILLVGFVVGGGHIIDQEPDENPYVLSMIIMGVGAVTAVGGALYSIWRSGVECDRDSEDVSAGSVE